MIKVPHSITKMSIRTTALHISMSMVPPKLAYSDIIYDNAPNQVSYDQLIEWVQTKSCYEMLWAHQQSKFLHELVMVWESLVYRRKYINSFFSIVSDVCTKFIIKFEMDSYNEY